MTTPPRRGRNPAARAVFAKHKAQIVARIEEGVMMKEIYRDLEFPGSYQQFHRYCQKALGREKERGAPPAPTSLPSAAPRPSSASIPADMTSAGPRRPVKRTSQAPAWDPANIDHDRLIGRTDT